MRKSFQCCFFPGDGPILECSDTKFVPWLWFSLDSGFCSVEQNRLFLVAKLTPSCSFTIRSMEPIAMDAAGLKC